MCYCFDKDWVDMKNYLIYSGDLQRNKSDIRYNCMLR